MPRASSRSRSRRRPIRSAPFRRAGFARGPKRSASGPNRNWPSDVDGQIGRVDQSEMVTTSATQWIVCEYHLRHAERLPREIIAGIDQPGDPEDLPAPAFVAWIQMQLRTRHLPLNTRACKRLDYSRCLTSKPAHIAMSFAPRPLSPTADEIYTEVSRLLCEAILYGSSSNCGRNHHRRRRGRPEHRDAARRSRGQCAGAGARADRQRFDRAGSGTAWPIARQR